MDTHAELDRRGVERVGRWVVVVVVQVVRSMAGTATRVWPDVRLNPSQTLPHHRTGVGHPIMVNLQLSNAYKIVNRVDDYVHVDRGGD